MGLETLNVACCSSEQLSPNMCANLTWVCGTGQNPWAGITEPIKHSSQTCVLRGVMWVCADGFHVGVCRTGQRTKRTVWSSGTCAAMLTTRAPWRRPVCAKPMPSSLGLQRTCLTKRCVSQAGFNQPEQPYVQFVTITCTCLQARSTGPVCQEPNTKWEMKQLAIVHSAQKSSSPINPPTMHQTKSMSATAPSASSTRAQHSTCQCTYL